MRTSQGFTLSELLISLAILGIIATFTIPKVLQSQSDEKYKSIAKEAMATVTNAYAAYRSQNTANAYTGGLDLTPYINYVRMTTTGAIDATWGNTGSIACDSTVPCFQLHSGAVLQLAAGGVSGTAFGGTTGQFYFFYKMDPDGKVTSSGNANGPAKSGDMILYFDGRATFLPYCRAGDQVYFASSLQNWCPGSANDVPDWGRW